MTLVEISNFVLKAVSRDPLGAVRTLVWTQIPSSFFEFVGIVFVSTGLGVAVWLSATNPRSIAVRLSSAYVTRLNTTLTSLYRPARGVRMAWLQACGAIALLATYGFVHNVAFLVAPVLTLVLPPVLVARSLAKRRKRLDDQANGFALTLANALKSTASVGDALWVALGVSSSPLKQELETMLKQVRVGSTMEEALLGMSARAQSSALDVLVSALLIGRQTGGDLPRILEGTAASLREIKRLEAHTDQVTRSARQSYAISAGVTVATAVGLPYVMPGFMDPLRDTSKGQVVAVSCVVAFLASAFMAYRITRTDV